MQKIYQANEKETLHKCWTIWKEITKNKNNGDRIDNEGIKENNAKQYKH